MEELLERVGLADRMEHKPTELSGGQMQRVAIARALAMRPDVLLADEPTGNLDSSAGGDIMQLFTQLWEQGRTVVVITHDMTLARRASRIVEIHDGRIVTLEGWKIFSQGSFLRPPPPGGGGLPGPPPPPPPPPGRDSRASPARREVIVYRERPARDYVWVRGFYDWQGDGWVWAPGHWLAPPARTVRWISPRYVREGWWYEPAHWSNQQLVVDERSKRKFKSKRKEDQEGKGQEGEVQD